MAMNKKVMLRWLYVIWVFCVLTFYTKHYIILKVSEAPNRFEGR